MLRTKKLPLLLLSLAFLLGIRIDSFADPVIQTRHVKTARAKSMGNAEIKMNTELRQWIDPLLSPEDAINWPNYNPSTLGSNPNDKWKLANHYIVLTTTLTAFNAAVQIITNNTNAAANPRWSDRTPWVGPIPPAPGQAGYDAAKWTDYVSKAHNPDSNPAGLVLNEVGKSSFTLPLAWTVKPANSIYSESTPAVADPLAGGDNRFQWHFMSDKATPAIDWNLDRNLVFDITQPGADRDGNGIVDDTPKFNNGDDSGIVIDAVKGFQVAQGTFNGDGAGSRIAHIFLQANFANAFQRAPNPDGTNPGLEYKTSQLLIELFTH